MLFVCIILNNYYQERRNNGCWNAGRFIVEEEERKVDV